MRIVMHPAVRHLTTMLVLGAATSAVACSSAPESAGSAANDRDGTGSASSGSATGSPSSGPGGGPRYGEAPPVPSDGLPQQPFLYPSTCSAMALRKRDGALSAGVKSVRVRARIAQSAGTPARSAVTVQRVQRHR